jgi:hypothetical protein
MAAIGGNTVRLRTREVEVFDSGWVGAWQNVVNKDPTFALVGKYFVADILFGFGDKEYLVSVRDGRIESVTNQITTETPSDFALRGPEESWAKFAQRVPPPFFNDIIAMSHPLHGKVRIEGNTKVFWQNLRALTWMLERMREVSVVEKAA